MRLSRQLHQSRDLQFDFLDSHKGIRQLARHGLRRRSSLAMGRPSLVAGYFATRRYSSRDPQNLQLAVISKSYPIWDIFGVDGACRVPIQQGELS